MRKIFTLLLSIVFFGSVYSQEYIPFPENDATWSLHNGTNIFEYYSILKVEGDSIINDISYKKIVEYMPDWLNWPSTDTIVHIFALYRQDIEDKKIHIIRTYFSETDEKLLYDFNADIGQTLSLPGLADYSALEDSLFNLEQVSEINMFDGTTRNRYRFRSLYSGLPCDVMEGIGSRLNPLGPSLVSVYPEEYPLAFLHLMCYTKNDEIIYLESDLSNCGLITTGIENTKQSTNELVVYPNPAKDFIVFELRENMNQTSVKIYDIYGKTIKELVTDTYEIQWDFENISSGVYFCSTQIDGITYRGKVIIK